MARKPRGPVDLSTVVVYILVASLISRLTYCLVDRKILKENSGTPVQAEGVERDKVENEFFVRNLQHTRRDSPS